MDQVTVKGQRHLARMATAVALLLLAAPPAAAQFGGSRDWERQQQQQEQQQQQRQRQQQQQQQQAPSDLKATPAVPEPWPRLESGALLCKSRDDLVMYQKQVASGASIFAAQRAAGCRSLGKQTGIQILDRDGPSRTQIVTSDDAKETGWTNTYLPDQKPAR